VSFLYDIDAHTRFVSSAMDAWFNYASAAIATCGAWQDHIVNQLEPEAQSKPQAPPSPYEQAFSWWTDMFMPPQPKQAAPDFGAGFFQFSPMHNLNNGFNPMSMFNPFSGFAAPTSPMPNAWATGWVEMMTAYSKAMPQFSWTVFQGPMTAWLMAVGMPYSVAAPTARGNAASMDAVVAARQGIDKMYSSFRTDGGHAVAPVLSSMQPMAALFFAPYLAASKSFH
jgi:hypothetical protein